jgi:hypothetical protein
MLDLSRYLLGVAEIALLGGFATLGAATLRARLLPAFEGAPAHLATAVIALALLIWAAELLGAFGLFQPLPYLLAVTGVGVLTWTLLPRVTSRRNEAHPNPTTGPAPGSAQIATLVALAIALMALVHFAADAKTKLSTGMTGFDSTWYHGPFAAGFLQSGNTWNLHFIAPQFLAWFYPANAEIFPAAGMLAFGRDVLSPLLNVGWLLGCLLACWCIGRPYRVAPWSLALGAIALSLPALADQAGEARNDIVGIFFLLAAVAIAVNAATGRRAIAAGSAAAAPPEEGGEGLSGGALVVVGLAAGLAAGTKLNYLPPAAVLVVGLAAIAPAGGRRRALGVAGIAALVAAGYWYLRNLLHTGNPLPWFDHLGPIALPAPNQALGGREGHSVLGYLGDRSVWSDWFLPGLHGGLTLLWPVLLALALAGLLLCVLQAGGPRLSGGDRFRRRSERWPGEGGLPATDRRLRLEGAVLCVAGLAGLAAAIAWLVAPTSASGPEGMPRGFESGLRYLAPALVLGLALLPATPHLRRRCRRLAAPLRVRSHLDAHSAGKCERIVGVGSWAGRRRVAAVLAVVVAAIALGYPVQRHYLRDRYASPSFAAPGLNAAFGWARSISGARIATTSTRQYPLYGTDLSNRVQFVGEELPHGGFAAPTTCPRWRRLLDAGDYDYVVASRDRVEPGKPAYPPTAAWTASPQATVVLRKPPTVVFKLNGPLDPSSCPS